MGFRAEALNLYHFEAQIPFPVEEYRYYYSFITNAGRMYEKQRGIENDDP